MGVRVNIRRLDNDADMGIWVFSVCPRKGDVIYMKGYAFPEYVVERVLLEGRGSAYVPPVEPDLPLPIVKVLVYRDKTLV